MFFRAEGYSLLSYSLLECATSAEEHKPRYVPHHNYDANFGEFEVESFARGQIDHESGSQRWIDAWIKTKHLSQFRLLGTGLYLVYKECSEIHTVQDFLLAEKVTEDRSGFEVWKVSFVLERLIPSGFKVTKRDLLEFAFFMDLENSSGEITRLWKSKAGKNFTLSDVFFETGEIRNLSCGKLEFAPSSFHF